MTSKTITLTGSKIKVDYSGGTNVWLRNDGAATIYAATTQGITAGADGVVSIPAGQAAAVYGACGTVYLLGTGSVLLVGSDYTTCPFKTATSSGGSGVDEVARAAIEAHSVNAEIHVTAAEKATWNGVSRLTGILCSNFKPSINICILPLRLPIFVLEEINILPKMRFPPKTCLFEKPP